MTKDYLKFRNAIKFDEYLSLEESYMLETLFDYYNVQLGYAYPSYEILMTDLNTKRKAKISKILKSLVKKGYIQIEKRGKKNTYKLLKYLFINGCSNTNNPTNKPKDSNGCNPLDGQVHITEIEEITEDEQSIMDLSKISQKQAKSLLEMTKNNTSKVMEYIKYALKRGIEGVYPYVRKLIKVDAKVVPTNWHPTNNNGGTFGPSCATNAAQYKYKKSIPFVENCDGRNYSDDWYKDIENRLLGWT